MIQKNVSVNAPRESKPGAAIPVASMVESIVGCKWSVRLLQLCAEGRRRPSEFLRACSGLSAKVMNERLRKMTRFGIVKRDVFGEKPPVRVEYRLTPFGLRFMGILEEVRGLQEAVDQGAVLETAKAEREEPKRGRLTRRPPRKYDDSVASALQPDAH